MAASEATPNPEHATTQPPGILRAASYCWKAFAVGLSLTLGITVGVFLVMSFLAVLMRLID